MQLSRRRIDVESLTSFGASLVYPSNSDGDDTNNSASRQQKDETPIGIRINGWEIITQNSSIGDEKGMERLTSVLEDAANITSGDSQNRRRLCPPEISFLDAKISLQHSNTATKIELTATDALMEWAEAHKYLDKTFGKKDGAVREYRGVQILKTKDAKAWMKKTTNEDSTSTSQFYYDWTFATPYAGSIHHPKNDTPGIACINNRKSWKPIEQSAIPFYLLQDTSQPILLYDDVSLFEDDLHDNGDVSLNVKVRVMPSCWYILQRLFLRVDHVCIKCREVRYFCYFGDEPPLGVEVNTVYRDIIWKEATWDDLLKLGLPTDPARWRCDDENAGVLNSLSQRLPRVELPVDLPKYSTVHLIYEI